MSVATAPSGRDWYAMRVPSGDHVGQSVPSGFADEVTWTEFLPSRSATQISSDPLRVELKAMRDPSGEMSAWYSRRDDRATGAASPTSVPSGLNPAR